MQTTRNQRRVLKKNNLKHSSVLVEIHKNSWPDVSGNRTRVFRSDKFLVQEFDESDSIRVSINRTVMSSDGRWDENISWDDIQDIKRELGYGDKFAIEIYPKTEDIVNVANMRHLWILPEPLNIGWRR